MRTVNYSDPFGLFECDKKTGEGCSAEYQRLLKSDKPAEAQGKSVEKLGMVVGMLDGAGESALIFQGGRAALREALSGGLSGLSAEQAGTIAAKLGKGAVDKITITAGEDGSVVAAFQRAGRNGYQVIERTLNAAGKETSVIQRAYDAAGKLVHYDPWKP
jgi:hypothetical protein